MKLLSLIAAVTLSTTAMANNRDHTGSGDPRQIARASYRAADDAEQLARQARYSCHNSYELASAANSLHYAVSDLYRAARRMSGGRVRDARDHNHDEIAALFRYVESSYYQVHRAYDYAGYNCGYDVRRAYQSLQWDFSHLEQVID